MSRCDRVFRHTNWRASLSRALALGYVAACILALLLMGTVMALQI